MLTSRGLGMLLSGILLCALTWATGASELLVLGVPAVVLPLLAWAWSRASFHVQVQRWMDPEKVVRGQRCVSVLAVTNRRSRSSAAIDVVDHRGVEQIIVAIPRLAAGATHRTSYDLRTDRRGVFSLGPLSARRADSFGLAASTVDMGELRTLYVHPRHYTLTSIPGGVRASLEGSTANIPFGSSVFHGLREYVVGDDHRRIHWLSTARAGSPQVTLYRDSSVPTLTVLLDDRASRYTDDRFEDAVEVAASVLDLFDRRELGLIVATASGTRLGTAGERVEHGDVMDFLTRVVTVPDTGARLFHPGVHPRTATVLVITGASTADDTDDLLQLRSVVAGLAVCAVTDSRMPSGVPDGTTVLTLSRADGLAEHWEELHG